MGRPQDTSQAGLMERQREPIQRKTPLKRSTKPLKRTGIKSKAAKPRRPKVTPVNKKRLEFTPEWPSFSTGKAIVKVRSKGMCEVAIVCGGRGVHENTHHRKLRRFNDHRPVNLLAVCFRCHDWIHTHVNLSYRNGYLVRSHDDPAKVKIIGWVEWPE